MIVALLIFLVTIGLVIRQPRGLGIGWSAIGGAAVALVAGVVTVIDRYSERKAAGVIDRAEDHSAVARPASLAGR